MRYLVTGATGFVGRHVARQLLEEGHEVVVLARTPSRTADLAAAGADVVRGDVTEKACMREGMAGVDGVFHLAGWYEIGAEDPTAGERSVYTSTLAVNSDTKGRLVTRTTATTGRTSRRTTGRSGPPTTRSSGRWPRTACRS